MLDCYSKVIFSIFAIALLGSVPLAYAVPDTWTAASTTNVGTTSMFGVSMSDNSNGVAVGTSGTIVFTDCAIETAADVNTIISSNCTVRSDVTAGGSVTVQSGAVMTIPNGVTLDINFATKNLTIESGSGVLIKAGGTIT